MRKGALEYCVLALLTDEARYGFEIVQRLSHIDGMLTSEGTMYPLLGRLRRDGLVQSAWKESSSGPPRRYYRLTAEGQRTLRGFKDEWTTFRSAVDRILETGGAT
jgi:PadR family transcriptional regulator, regulatory protein PadR